MKKNKKHNLIERPLVAIDLSSSGIKAMAAQKTEQGLKILAYEQSERKDFMEYGIVTNSTEAGFQIGTLMKLLRNDLKLPSDYDIPSVFLTYGGKWLQSVEVDSRRDMLHKQKISHSVIEDIEEECRNKVTRSYPKLTVLRLIPSFYELDEQNVGDVVEGKSGRYLNAHYVAFVATSNMSKKINDSIDRCAPLVIEQAWAKPEALMTAISTEDDIDEGIAILDLGAQTTTLTLFREHFLHTRVFPGGGDLITKDIAALGITFDQAERIKCKLGAADPKQILTSQSILVPSIEGNGKVLKISTPFIARIINARLQEILGPLLEDLNNSQEGIKHLFVVGGGALLKGIIPYLSELVPQEVDFGSHAEWLADDNEEKFLTPMYSALIGTLALGDDYRQLNIPLKKPKIKNFWENLKDGFTIQFEGVEENLSEQ